MKVFLKLEQDRIYLESQYSAKLVNIYKRYDGYKWDNESGLTSFPKRVMGELIADIVALGVVVEQVIELKPRERFSKIVVIKHQIDGLEIFLKSFTTKVRIKNLIVVFKIFLLKSDLFY